MSVVDPALFYYKYEDWLNKAWHCYERFEALVLHHNFMREYGQVVAMSDDYLATIFEVFPWQEDYAHIGELRDLRQFILEDLQRIAKRIEPCAEYTLKVEPEGLVCNYVHSSDMVEIWKYLICGCVKLPSFDNLKPQVATWSCHDACDRVSEIQLKMESPTSPSDCDVLTLPLVWDEDSWIVQLATLDWWPNVERCVELYVRANPSMRHYYSAGQAPTPVKCTPSFMRSVESHCSDVALRRALIESLSKKMFGVTDAGLGDESVRRLPGMRRFRVTDYWRVHYRRDAGHIVLEEFGPHGIGGVD